MKRECKTFSLDLGLPGIILPFHRNRRPLVNRTRWQNHAFGGSRYLLELVQTSNHAATLLVAVFRVSLRSHLCLDIGAVWPARRRPRRRLCGDRSPPSRPCCCCSPTARRPGCAVASPACSPHPPWAGNCTCTSPSSALSFSAFSARASSLSFSPLLRFLRLLVPVAIYLSSLQQWPAIARTRHTRTLTAVQRRETSVPDSNAAELFVKLSIRSHFAGLANLAARNSLMEQSFS